MLLLLLFFMFDSVLSVPKKLMSVSRDERCPSRKAAVEMESSRLVLWRTGRRLRAVKR